MPASDSLDVDPRISYESVLPDLQELCRIHDVGIELIERSHDLDELLHRVLEEYERRLGEMGPDTLQRQASEEEAGKLRALVMFASRAAALKEKAVAASELRRRTVELERLNGELERALSQEARLREHLDDVLEALDAGILVVAADGSVENANRAAARLTDTTREKLVGERAEPFLGDVNPGSDGEVVTGAERARKVLLVARRGLPGDRAGEVVLLSDVTQPDREVQERHRLEKLRDLFKTLAALSHKINNPLTALMGRAQILQLKKGNAPDVTKAAEVINESAQRVASYIRELTLVVREGREEALAELLERDGPLEGAREEERS